MMDNKTEITIDIETVPSQRPGIMEHLANKLPADLDFEEAEKQLAIAFDRTALNAAFGEIVSISAAVNDGTPKVWCRPLGGSEKQLLLDFRTDFMKVVKHFRGNVRLVGLNVLDFDRPFIVQRGFVHGLWMPTIFVKDVKPWEKDDVVDLMHDWTRSAKGRISLDDLCFALGLEGKGPTTGASVYKMMKEGRHVEVGQYNASDVIKTRACRVRMCALDWE